VECGPADYIPGSDLGLRALVFGLFRGKLLSGSKDRRPKAKDLSPKTFLS